MASPPSCIIIIKKPRNLAEKSRMILWLEVDCTWAGQLCCWQTPRCHRTLLARSTGKATKGWATINALQFIQSEPWINILTIREQVLARVPRRDVPMILRSKRDGSTVPYQPKEAARLVHRLRDKLRLPATFTLNACRHDGV
jgi:hypothetical protein